MNNFLYILYLWSHRLLGRFWFKEEKQFIATPAEKLAALSILKQGLVEKYLKRHAQRILPDFSQWEKLTQVIIKNHQGKKNVTCVVRYELLYVNNKGQQKKADIYFNSSSDNSRRHAWDCLTNLNGLKFSTDHWQIIKPYDYVPYWQCLVYLGAPGRSLLFYTQNTSLSLTPFIRLAAGWLKHLHNLPGRPSSAWQKKYIYQMIPRPSFLAWRITKVFGSWGRRSRRTLLTAIRLEKKWGHAKTNNTMLCGDYHPANIIFASSNPKSVTIIDYADMSLGDSHRDLGTFLQQFSWMARMHRDKQQIYYYKRIFLETYFGCAYHDIPLDSFRRINLYQAWTALRSAVFIFLMEGSGRLVFELIDDAEKYINKIEINAKTVNIK